MPDRLQTERLLLQRLRYEDAEEIFYAYASKEEATRFVSWATHRSVDDTRRFLAYAVESWDLGIDYNYSIRLRNGMLIGSIGMLQREGEMQLGYILSPTHWGSGYATEACIRVLAYAKHLGPVGTFVDAENTASIKVLKKCGMVQEAVQPRWFRFTNQDNEAKDCVIFRLER